MRRRQKEIDDGLQEIKMVVLIPVDFAVHMVRLSIPVYFLIYFLIDC